LEMSIVGEGKHTAALSLAAGNIDRLWAIMASRIASRSEARVFEGRATVAW
jgi:hypothetical protein